ncbi:MAG: hypothetical protein ABI626_01775 [Sphingomicrobium sp.]
MRDAIRYLILLSSGVALLACKPAPQPASNNSAATEIESVPPDESVEAPPSEPANNADAAND